MIILEISLIILSAFCAFSLWVFLKYSPRDENKAKYILAYNIIIFLVSILFCMFYTYYVFEVMEGFAETERWAGMILLILGYLIIFSVCLLSGFVVRLLIFRKAYKDLKSLILTTPVIISFILLAAHFLRDNNIIFAFFILTFLFLILYFLEPVSVKAAKTMLVFGTIEWIRSGYVLAALRIQTHEPFLRLVIIMGGVACFTLLSSLVFSTKPIKERYKISIAD